MRIVLCSAVLLLAGCDVFGSSLEAAFTARAARPDIALALKNTGDEAFGVGVLQCAVTVEIDNDGWEEADYESLALCVDVLNVVEPGETLEEDFSIKGLGNGLYRFRVTVEGEGGSTRTVVSNEIRIASADG